MINLVSRRYVSNNSGSITTIIWNKASGIIQVWYKYQIDDIETCINVLHSKTRCKFIELCDYYSQF